MQFRVFQNGKRCNSYEIKGWNVDTFNSQREAEIYAFAWAYPVTKEVAAQIAPAMELDREYDYSMGAWSEEAESPVRMVISQVDI